MFFVVLLLLSAVSPLGAQGFFKSLSWSAKGSVLFLFEDNGMRSDPMPILPSLGFGAAYPISAPMWIELTGDFYFTHYGYDFTLDRAVPYAIENRSSFVIGSVLGLQAVALFDLTPVVSVRVYGGPAADLRIVLVAEDLNEGVDDMDGIRRETRAVKDYFWGKGRWFLPFFGTGADFNLNSKIKLGLDLRVWFPLYRLWSGEDLPAAEGWRFGMGMRITFRRGIVDEAE